MIRNIVRIAGALAGLAMAAVPAAAQRVGGGERALSLDVQPYAGYMIQGKYASGPLGTDLRPAGTSVWGAQLGIPLAHGVSLVGNVAYAQGDLRAGIPILGGGINFGTNTTWMYDGGLQFGGADRVARVFGVSPVVQVGAGAIQRSVSIGGVTAHATDFAGNAGIGADVVVIPGVALRLMAKDYIGKASFGSSPLEVETKTMSNLALTAGIKIMF